MKIPTNKKRRRYHNATMRLVDSSSRRRREKAPPTPATMSPPLEVGPTVAAASWGKRVGSSSPSREGDNTAATTPKWTADDFRVDGLLGAGRFGRVYSAVVLLDYSLSDRRPVALKCLNKHHLKQHPQDAERLRREINIQSQ